MKIGIVSTLYEKCGIASYSESLIDGLISKGIEVKVAANVPKDQLKSDPDYVKRFFNSHYLTNSTLCDVKGMFNYLKDVDIVHVQFQTNLFSLQSFIDFLQLFSILPKPPKIVFTAHDGLFWHSFPMYLCDHYISHTDMFCSNSIIPMGIKFYDDIIQEPKSYKSATSIGLGRNNDDLVRQGIDGLGVIYRSNYGHQNWLLERDLITKIKESWIIFLLYPKIDVSVSSSAAMLALSTERPLVISNTSWFSTIINYPNIYVCENIQDIKEHVTYLTNPNNLEKIKEDIKLMKERIINDKRDYSTFIDRHIDVYNNLLRNS